MFRIDFNEWLSKYRFDKLRKVINNSNYTVGDTDLQTKSILINNEVSSILVSLSPNCKVIQFECTLIFDADLNNLKTLSSLLHTAYYYSLRATGVMKNNDHQVKIYLSTDLDYQNIKQMPNVLKNISDCIETVVGYLYFRGIQTDTTSLDISMFEGLDLFLFDPQLLGEKKDFQFGDWSAFANSVLGGEYESGLSHDGLIEEIRACEEFENRNNMLLSEVGDRVFEEVLWNRQFKLESENDEYSVN